MEGVGKQQKHVQGEWLNLRLGRKVFTCKFCDREFHSSQALGGHQNAHRREKTMFAHCMAASRPPPLDLHHHSRLHQPPAAATRREEQDALDLDLKL